ncbi:MAG: glycosyltransferase family 4 protein [Verrucomicrobia bacterium]|nr:glycosyltransferase family 4 protein [Verrucomicrobiota bacterium]
MVGKENSTRIAGEKLRKRIATIAQYYPPHVGGLEIVAQKLAQSLVEYGHEVSVVTCSTTAPGTSTENGVKVRRCKAFNHLDNYFSIPFAFFGRNVFEALKTEIEAADLVHIHDVLYPISWIAYLLARRYAKPVCIIQHVALVFHTNASVRMAQQLVYRTVGKAMLNRSNQVIAYNKTVKQFFLKLGLRDGQVVQMRNGVDLDLFSPSTDRLAETRLKYGLGTDKPIVLFVGRLVPKKGFQLLLQTAGEDIQLVFVGSGKLRHDEQLLPNARFLSALGQAELAELYRASDLFVLPSTGEVFPLAAQEAMASGLPLILGDDPGYSEYRIDRAMITLVRPEPVLLSRAIRQLLGDASRLAKMRLYSRRFAEEHFDWETNLLQESRTYVDLPVRAAPASAASARCEIHKAATAA